MEDLSLHILDIAENSLRAGAGTLRIRVIEQPRQDRLILEIKDDGAGMDEQAQSRALNPFFTTQNGKRVGLGLALLAQAAEDTGGRVEISSIPGHGTNVRAEFDRSHVDLKPMGDIQKTLRILQAGHPDVRIEFEHNVENGGPA